jgi:hypothetical protein
VRAARERLDVQRLAGLLVTCEIVPLRLYVEQDECLLDPVEHATLPVGTSRNS